MRRILRLAVLAAVILTVMRVDRSDAFVVGTKTITSAIHYGYFGFPSTSANNTKAVVGPFTGVARTIRVSGTITEVHPAAWVKSIRVQPTGAGLATYQPWFQFSNQYDFTGTIPVSATIYAPGGFSVAQAMSFEMYSIDDESFVPGIDAVSTLTYTFDDAYPVGTAEYSGTLGTGDPTFNRPIQFETNPPGYTAPFLSGRTPYYDVQPFHVSMPGTYSMVTANEFYSAGVLYANSFNPASPLTNVVRAFSETGNVLRSSFFNNLTLNGDATGGTVITTDLQPGVQYYFVTSAYTSPATAAGEPVVGRYRNIITGDGVVSLGVIPEPASPLLAAVIGSMAMLRRR